MKTTLKLLLTAIVAVFCCSIGNAQIIYSNNFALGGSGNISNMPPTLANTYAGGTNTALWLDALGTNDTGALFANGTVSCTQGDSWLLPFVPQTNNIYLLTANVTFTGNPGTWVGVGFSQFYTNNAAVGHARFADDSAAGYDFLILTESTGNVQYFGGSRTANAIFSSNGAFTAGPGTHTVWVILNTKVSPWMITAYVDGVQMGKSFTYVSNPTIRAVGITQNALTTPSAVQWNYLTLTTALQPFITQQPTSQALSYGFAYTNTVSVLADTNGGPLSFQWYANGAPLVNGGSISGANTNTLVINPVSSANALSNYYAVVANNYGSVTSSLASLTVYTNPIITGQFPLGYTNPITLFGGTGGSMGSSPTFSLSTVGAQPFVYLWFTNGVLMSGATNSSFTFTNAQLNGPTNFTAIVSNSFGTATNTWSVAYTPAPTAAYPQAILGAQPYDFWRLNEPDNGLNNGNRGVICNDYQSGNNGIYTNTLLGQTGYNPSEPTETSAFFGQASAFGFAGQIQNVDFSVTNGGNAAFSVEAWANCISGGLGGGGPVIIKGTNGVNEAFALGVDTNSAQNYQFSIRTAGGTVYRADSSIPAGDSTWHHLVGVCDEVNSNLFLYVDGRLVASTNIPAKSGLLAVGAPVMIGAGYKSSGNVQFFGNIDDVATYRRALTSEQVAQHYIAVSGSLPPIFSQTPPATVTANDGGSLVIAARLIGSGPMTYTWVDLNTSTTLASGSTNGTVLDATLNANNIAASMNGDQLLLTVNNSAGSATAQVTLNVISGAPQIVTDVQSYFGAPLGGSATNSIAVGGSLPFSYQWQFNDTNLTDNGHISGSQSSALSIANAQLSDIGNYQVIVANSSGSVTSRISSFVVFDNNQPVHFNGNGLGWSAQQLGTYTTTAITNGLLTLTDGGHNEARGFFFNYPQSISQFKASFTYQATGGDSIADGATFCIQNDPRGAAVVGGIGGSLGVGVNGSTPAISPSAQLQLHIYALSTGGIGYAFGNNGIIGTDVPTGNLVITNAPIDITVAYAGGQLALTFSNEVSAVTYGTNFSVGDLTQQLGSSSAYVGFTGSSGGVGAIQTVTNFTFVSTQSVISPTLSVQLSGTNVVVSWPATASGFTLQETANLRTGWVTVTNAPVLNNNQNQVTLPVGSGDMFYRLIQ